MTRLVVRLLGGFRVEADGEPVYGFETDKARALFSFLIVEADRPHRRETLAGLLWPDRPDTVARANLRQALVRLRRALGDDVSQRDQAQHHPAPANHVEARRPPPFLFVTRTDVQFNAASDYALDVAQLEAFTRPQAGGPLPRLQLLPEVLCADFLAGFAIPESETFQAWVLNRQEHCHRLALDILEAQNAAFESAGDFEHAVAAARLQLRMEPWLEEAHRRCMRGLALAGRRDEALHQYELCRLALEAELGAGPAPATEALCASIRAGRLLPAPQLARPARQLQISPPARALPFVQEKPLAALVARQDELSRLARYFEEALAGEPSVAFVSGDAGSGKTLLLEAFAAYAMARRSDLLVAGARCSPGGEREPFAPLHRLAEMLFGDLTSEIAWPLLGRDLAGRLQDATTLVLTALAAHGDGLVEALVPPASISRRAGRSGPPTFPIGQPGSAALSQGALFDQLLRTLAEICRERPLLLLFDDLHWVDDASATFLAHLGRELSCSRLLVVGAYRTATLSLGRRDDRTGEMTRHPLAAVVNELRRTKGDILIELDRADGQAFVEAYVDTEPNRLGSRFRNALYAHTGGHALFTVETLRNLQERGELFKDEADRWVARESLDWGALPARVEAAIAERIERLPETSRRFLAAASVQGDDFTAELVAELTGAPIDEVIAALSGSLARQHYLVRSEGLQRAPAAPGAAQPSLAGPKPSAPPRVRSVYRFRHHLFQKYLYDELDPVERARWHAVVASSLEREIGEDPRRRERLGAQLGWHYESAGMPIQAARALLDAGRQATVVSAFREALNLFDHGLALLHQVDAARPAGSTPAAPAQQVELQRLLQIARLVPQRTLSGSGDKELEGALAQVIEAGVDGVQGRTQLAALSSEGDHLIARGQFEEVLHVAQRILDLATQCGDEAFAALAHFWFGFTYHLLGELRQADDYFEWIFARHTPGRWAELRGLIGFDLLPHSLAISAINKLSLGYSEEALARSSRAVTIARELEDQYGLAFASAVGSMTLFLLRNDRQALQERSELCCRHCEKHGFAWWQYYATAFLGWLTVKRGEPEKGIDDIHGAIAAWQATGMLLGTDSLAILLADACLEAVRPPPRGSPEGKHRRGPADPLGDVGRAGLLAEALTAIDAALAPDSMCGHCYQAELYRMRGELLLARDGLAAARRGARVSRTGAGVRTREGRARVGAARCDERRAPSCPCLRPSARRRNRRSARRGARRPQQHLRPLHRGLCFPRLAAGRSLDPTALLGLSRAFAYPQPHILSYRLPLTSLDAKMPLFDHVRCSFPLAACLARDH